MLDPVATAIERALVALGHEDVFDVKMSRLIEMKIKDGNVQEKVEKLCHELLVNPVIENFQYVVEEDDA